MLSLPAIAKRLTGGFKVAKMALRFPYRKEWDVALNPSVVPILSQSYKFLGRGAQCFVFESEDGCYVIKLFRYDQPPTESKVRDLFNACKLAYEELPEETGLVYIHLNVTELGLPTLQCRDAVGRKYAFPLDKMRFALQKKAAPFLEALTAAKGSAEMEKKIDQLIGLLKTRTDRKIFNSDPSLSRNFGFLEDRAIEFDFGNYRKAFDLNQKREMNRFASKLRKWLVENDPNSVAYFDQKMEAIL